ncbi:MAG: DUF4142 domain-containing protein [Burkholderiales bacterium]
MQHRFALVTFIVAGAALACSSAFAQGTAPSASGSNASKGGTAPSAMSPATPSPPAPGSTGMDKGMGTGASSKGGQSTNATDANTMAKAGALSSGDRKFVQEAAEGSKAEVSGGQMAQSKGSSDSVKQFGQRMATDHQKAYDQLSQIASSKGVTVPTEPSKAHQRDAAKLEKLSGNDFDREYAKQMVSDHKKDVSEFRKQAKSAKDPDVRNFAATTLPTLEEHLKMAQDMESTVKKERTAKAGR